MPDKADTPSDASSEVTLRELLIKRSSIKGQITKFKKYLSQLKAQRELSSLKLAELSLKISRLEGLSTKFDDLQSEIEVLNSEKIDSELDERDKIESELINCIALAKELFGVHSEPSKDQSICHHDQQDPGFKLPQIQISKFDGAYFRWLEFRDTFENLIHKNDRISPIHKYHYLISYLEGDAARLISNLEVSTKNYAEAWKIIYDRYNNKRSLINHHLKSLFNVQPIIKESDRSLRFLVDHVTKNLRALSSLDQPTDKWDILLIYMLSNKLDSQTLTKWEEYRNTLDTDVPTLQQFNKFLIDRADVLEALSRSKVDSSSSKGFPSVSRPPIPCNNNSNNHYKMNHQNYNNKSQNQHGRVSYTKSFAATNQNTGTYLCIICNENHKIYDCSAFKSKSLEERLAEVSRYKLCPNCLRQGHPVTECRMGPCRDCKQQHNSLLHAPSADIKTNMMVSEPEFVVNHSNQNQNQILLSTVLLEVSNPVTNKTERVRALLDCGSQSSFISKALKDKLNLKSIPTDAIKVIGIGNSCSNSVSESCNAKLKSLNGSYTLMLSCFVLSDITSEIPKVPINIKELNLPKHLPLADPTFHHPASIDVLIGADVFWDILENEQCSLGTRYPTLRSSKFGWLISGPVPNSNNKSNKIYSNHVLISSQQNEIDETVKKFWELEELPKRPILSQNEKFCEEHFLKNTSRQNNGRFCVRLPMSDSPDCLGDTYNQAKRRFLNLEKKFNKNPPLKADYANFINEYAELNHLSDSKVTKPENSYFLCHHAVYKDTSESTKLRVVFDGSAPSSSGFSLNDILRTGPNVQDSLFSILIRSRQYKFILSGDIEKMYRQVKVHDDDCNLQLILWREDESKPIKTLKLNTLTYGTASASYLSTRCLWQLGEEQEDALIKTIIQHDFYIDDLITGSDDETQLLYIQKSVTEALKSGCFNLRKFKSNSKSIYENATHDNLNISESASTLGLGWDPLSDSLNFPLKEFNSNDKITKRYILSNSFKIFDPLGLLSPFIIQPKIMLQNLWKEKLDWDQPVPQKISQEWDRFTKNLSFLKEFQVPRWVLCNSPKEIELHSFSDASQVAYGACIYMRTIDESNKASVKLLCSKSKVAPLKPTTMPRLELCAALLAARLSKTVLEALRYKPTRAIHWCDSSIVIGWINSDVTKLKSFVANRILEIHELTSAGSWRYVPTAANPADLISRGVTAKLLVSMKLWWSGPEFLSEKETKWPILNKNNTKNNNELYLPEVKSIPVVISAPVINIENYSKLNKLIRIVAYVKRFIQNIKNPNNKLISNLTLEELDDSFTFLCINAQRESFSLEYDLLLKNKEISPRSKILSLSPFLDDKKLLRVGGRIDAAECAYEVKHPILLHAKHHLTKLYFEREHLRKMHAGPQLLLASVREVVWPVGGRHLARRSANKCVVCRRVRGKTLTPKMGNLPYQRVTPGFPFSTVGVDFAGPFYILNRKGRGSRLIKCYLCLFICLRYKCVHLEIVSDLSSNAFLMTLRRFIARRGKPKEIYCDNGRNFVAASKEIRDCINNQKEPINHFANEEQIKFHFSPAYAPHFGGIWEAGVKSAKFHLRRVVGNNNLTFEEITTLFAQVEAILNSRPLCPLSSSPTDLLPLSPGHFIIGRPLTALPGPDLQNVKEHNLRRYERVEKIRQHFWRRWQREYVLELQQRTKWKTNTTRLNNGDLVLLQEDNAPPLSWRLGRVARLFPGPDGISRVADVNTIRGCVRRPLVRLCPLPTAEEFSG